MNSKIILILILIIVSSVTIQLINIYVSKKTENERLKRKELIGKISELKDKYRKNKDIKDPFELFNFKNNFDSKEQKEEFQDKIKTLLKEYNIKKYKVFLPVVINISLIIAIFYFFRINGTIPYISFIPYCTVIITFFSLFSRKRVIFSMIAAILVLLIVYRFYFNMNMELNLIICANIIIKKIINKIIKRKGEKYEI